MGPACKGLTGPVTQASRQALWGEEKWGRALSGFSLWSVRFNRFKKHLLSTCYVLTCPALSSCLQETKPDVSIFL